MWWFTRNDGTRFKKAVIVSLVVSLLLETTGAAQVIVVNRFPANRGPGYRKPYPDAAGAVGPRHTAVLDDRAFVVDPLDSTLIWTCQEYANSSVEREWCTAWTAFQFNEHKKSP